MNVYLNRILIVEDNENDLELTLDALRVHSLANNIDVARDGVEALDYLFYRGKWADRKNGNPAVVLLDLKLPKVNGLEVLKQIRANEKTKVIPVVILTSSREEKDIIDGYKLGTNAYVVKPVEFEKFMKAVETLGAFWALINEPPKE